MRDGAVWKHSAVDKAELFATVFQSKCIVPCLEVNEYSEVAATAADSRQFGLVEETLALQVLSEIRSDSATGPESSAGAHSQGMRSPAGEAHQHAR